MRTNPHRGWAPVDSAVLELTLLLGSTPSCYVRTQWAVLEPRERKKGGKGDTSPKKPRLPPRTLRFCFEPTQTRIFYRTWNGTVEAILSGEPENLTAHVNLIF